MIKVLQWRYLFASEPGPELPLYPVIVVATEGSIGDWAAYIAGVPLSAPSPDERDDWWLTYVAANGAKLDRAAAIGFFPYIIRPYRE